MPNPSIERALNGVPPLWAAHVERWATRIETNQARPGLTRPAAERDRWAACDNLWPNVASGILSTDSAASLE